MLVERLRARAFRNLAEVELALGGGITLVVGENGAGKTNLLEALYFGLAGASWRTRAERELIGFGSDMARVEVDLREGAQTRRFVALAERAGAKRRRIDGNAPKQAADPPGVRPAIGVFSPDRLALVKGAPAMRRSHLDRFIAALWPARGEVRRRYGRALAQRNALLSRVRAGAAGTASLDAWDAELASEGAALIAARREAVETLAPPFRQLASELGLDGKPSLRYRPRSEADDAQQLAAELEQRRGSDLERGFTGHGPHLDELELELVGRSLRRYGSQGQQRIALLALLFSEREALLEITGTPPLMLLDDVMSELDAHHRARLTQRLAPGGQALITATETGQLPEDCEHVEVRVRAGVAAALAIAA
jgi:DNA replication and repair protein RecF